MMPFFTHICVSGVERRESEQGAGLLSVGLPGLKQGRTEAQDFIKILKMVYYPELLVWVSQEPFPYKEMEGSLTKGRLPVPKEVNRKKAEEISAAFLAPPGSQELCSPNISYLYSF
ncbi:neuronal regeneration-related protein [Microtus ochrogaster]|uniref:Neuronal regeneration-related protein n=1 Tax=Microtus ochrogaster TaxID=79684 RepID=A0ABM1UBF0_MICOH|nr:neuronal regeneration-related protein [Microtus ochrogaster]